MRTEPNLDASGQAGAALVPNPIWAGGRASRPWADEGDTVIPSGKVTTASARLAVAGRLGTHLAAGRY